MKMEEQVTNYELSKRLKELGAKQESQFKYCGGHLWYEDGESDDGKFEECGSSDLLQEDEYCHSAMMTCEYFVSAFTAEELETLLPVSIKVNGDICHFLANKTTHWHRVGYENDGATGTWARVNDSEPHIVFTGKSLASARGLLLEYLLDGFKRGFLS